DRALMEQARAKVRIAEGARTRILVVDDHVAVREGLRSLIGEYDDLEIVGEAAGAEEGLRLARRHRPDVIVLDNEMPGRSGIDVVRELRDDVPLARIVMFSLDGAARERAIEAGAHTFIVKDAPMDEILAALRPERTVAPASQRPGPVPRPAGQHRLRHAAVVIAVAAGVYAAVFLIVESVFGAAAGAFAVIPVVMVAALLGSGAGAFAGALIIALNAFLWTVTGHGVGESILTVGDPGFGMVILLLVGFGVGAIRDLRLLIDPRRARVETVAEAARAFAGIERGEVVGVYLEAVLRVVPADLAVLYAATGGEPRLVASSHALDAGMSERVAATVRGAMRSPAARVIDEVPEADRPLARTRSALLAPVALPDHDLQGVLVLFSSHPFAAADLARARLFAQHLSVAMSNADLAPGRAAAHARERLS
ncbi:MAG TPA: response regulator transcription factor, partial [Candidatus Limnocylindria bacterium]|nr:response regulator transcription factor [Candidatus Limnocylindria bacterium]